MEIVNYREVRDKPSVAAEFDIYIPAFKMTLRKWKLIRSKQGHTFPSAPSFAVGEDGDKKTYVPYVTFGEDRDREFRAKLDQALEAFKR